MVLKRPTPSQLLYTQLSDYSSPPLPRQVSLRAGHGSQGSPDDIVPLPQLTQEQLLHMTLACPAILRGKYGEESEVY